MTTPTTSNPVVSLLFRGKYALLAIGLLLLVSWGWARPSRVVASSMTPTLMDGDYAFVSTHAPWVKASRGTVVAARLPLIPSTRIVKRIVALGGDTVAVRNQRFVVNHKDAGSAPGADQKARVLPPNTMYLLGDHRSKSIDSREIGPFPVDCLWGRPVLIYWSSSDSAGRWWRHIRWDRIGRIVS